MCSSDSSDSSDSSGQTFFAPKLFFWNKHFFFFFFFYFFSRNKNQNSNCDKTKKKSNGNKTKKKINGDKAKQNKKLWQNTKSQRGMVGTLSLIHCVKLLQPFSKHSRVQQVCAYNPSFLTIM